MTKRYRKFPIPDWDLEQLEVIMEHSNSWQLVTAGPGSGKSAVACQRVAYLLDEGVSASRILLVSFTRTAVAELQNRIFSYAIAGEKAKSVLVTTIDSHAWSIRSGFSNKPSDANPTHSNYDDSISLTVDLLRSGDEDLLDFMSRLEHLVIDEAQDITGIRSSLILEILNRLSATCGVSIFADPAQAIYGFTNDNSEESHKSEPFLEAISNIVPNKFIIRRLKKNHRVRQLALSHLFLLTRKEIEKKSFECDVESRVRKLIFDTCGRGTVITTHKTLTEFLSKPFEGSMLVLFRRRADVIIASSFCSSEGLDHKLRLSGTFPGIKPWLGWLFGETNLDILHKSEFESLWTVRANMSSEPFVDEERESCWNLLHRLSAASRPNAIDLVRLRTITVRENPPIDLCFPELGVCGPILGTIHASKGREADNVVLVIPRTSSNGKDSDALKNSEEGRVYYVAATRARKMLKVFGGLYEAVDCLDSKRIYRQCGPENAQIEIGQKNDVDSIAHLKWEHAKETQSFLANNCRRSVRAKLIADPENKFYMRIVADNANSDKIFPMGMMSSHFTHEIGRLWTIIDRWKVLKPSAIIKNVYSIGSSSIALSEQQRSEVEMPYARSGFALKAVVKGFSMVHFTPRAASGRH